MQIFGREITINFLKTVLRRIVFLFIGATIGAFALECFLIPNKIVDGGIIGISMMTAYKTGLPLGYIIVAFNFPFIILALKRLGKQFVFYTFMATVFLAAATAFVPELLHHKTLQNPFLACIFGGVILGIGVGTILRNHGSTDGTEMVAVTFAKKTPFSVGEIIMFFNLFIFFAAGIVYKSWESALYSVLTYYITYKVIDIVLEGLNESKSIFIITDHAEKVGRAIMTAMDTSVTYIDAEGGYSGRKKRLIYCVISRLEITKIKFLTKEIDPTAFIAIENVHEVEGVRVKKKHY
ncbi:MAG: YitT family protein [Candidatus Gastranaerophilales bacterium]|nr:YitT family protein [Candidatus Gastranaerophilales bacterium]